MGYDPKIGSIKGIKNFLAGKMNFLEVNPNENRNNQRHN